MVLHEAHDARGRGGQDAVPVRREAVVPPATTYGAACLRGIATPGAPPRPVAPAAARARRAAAGRCAARALKPSSQVRCAAPALARRDAARTRRRAHGAPQRAHAARRNRAVASAARISARSTLRIWRCAAIRSGHRAHNLLDRVQPLLRLARARRACGASCAPRRGSADACCAASWRLSCAGSRSAWCTARARWARRAP